METLFPRDCQWRKTLPCKSKAVFSCLLLSVAISAVLFYWSGEIRINDIAIKRTFGEDDVSFYIVLRTHGGLGNKVSALVGMLALARASKRQVAVSGPGVIWRSFWESTFTYKSPPKQAQGLRRLQLHCDVLDLLDSESACHNCIFDSPEATIILTIDGGFGDSARAALSHPLFKERYLDLIHDIRGTQVRSDLIPRLMFVMELPTVFSTPTSSFARLISKFSQQHELGGDWLFDAAIHVRKCIDCGWNMSETIIEENVRCAVDLYQSMQQQIGGKEYQWKNTTFFLTSDTRNTIPIVIKALPEGVRLIENIPETFLHTHKISNTPSNFEALAMPYLDNYLLGRSKMVASCFTSFGQVGALRVGGVGRLNQIIIFQHKGQEEFLVQNLCHPLVSISAYKQVSPGLK